VSYAWTVYPAPDSSASIPILVDDLICTVNATPSDLSIYTVTTDGVQGGANESSQNGLSVTNNLITDDVNIYVAYLDHFPRSWTAYWSVSGLAFTANLNGDLYVNNGYVKTSGSGAVETGADNANVPAACVMTLPNSVVNYTNYPAYAGQLGYVVFDGASVWAVLIGSDNLFQIDPVTLVETVYTLPHAVAFFGQLGFDGRYLYIPDGSDIIIFDTVALTSALNGAVTGGGHCWYSANLGAVVFAENESGGCNLFTFPAGGGAYTAIGNLDTVVAPSAGDVYCAGMCDGPDGDDLWASAYQPVGSAEVWSLVYRPSSGNPMRLLL
jgi:hypothetical protein